MQPLNYTSAAITDLRGIDIPQYPVSHVILKETLGLLDKAVPFLLPDGGDILEWDSVSRAVVSPLPRLPFPICALEVFYPVVRTGLDAAGRPTIPVRKRLVLCVEIDAVPPGLLRRTIEKFAGAAGYPELKDGIAILPFWFHDEPVEGMENGCWSPGSTGAIIPRVQYEDGRMDRLMIPNILKDDGSPGARMGFGFILLPFMPELFDGYFEDIADPAAVAAQDVFDEVLNVAATLAALSCSNARIEHVAPPEKLNKKRAKSGKPPLRGYAYVTISPFRSDGKPRSAGGIVEDRRSPREHLRRGHIRRYQSGKNVWIQATVVNPGQKEKVRQTYLISPGGR